MVGIAAAVGGDDMNIDSPVDSTPRHPDSRNVDPRLCSTAACETSEEAVECREQASLAHVRCAVYIAPLMSPAPPPPPSTGTVSDDRSATPPRQSET